MAPVALGDPAVAPRRISCTRPNVPLGMSIAVAGFASWLAYAMLSGPSLSGDSESYIGFARVLAHGQLLASERTPGYPMLIAVSEGVGSMFACPPLRATLIVQVFLLTAVGAYLVYDIAARITARSITGAIAACLYVGDADTQNLGAWIMSEALAVPLFLGAIWLRERDESWRRGGWLVGMLVLTRPQFIFMPPLVAVLELLRLRRPKPVFEALLPTAVLLVGWYVAVSLGATSANRPVEVFGPRHAFGKIYEFDLWRAVPDSPAKRLVAEEKARGHDAYEALERLSNDVGPHAWRDLFGEVIRHDPGGLVLAMARALPRGFRQATLWTPTYPSAAFPIVTRWHAVFWGVLFWPPPMMIGFCALMMAAAMTGFGWHRMQQLYAWVLTPVVAALFITVALLAMGTDQVGRLCSGFRPFYFIALSAAAVSIATRMRQARRYST